MARETTYLADQFFIHLHISLRPIQSLFKKSQQHRDDDDRLQSLPKDDKKNRDSKDLRHCVFLGYELFTLLLNGVGN